MSSDEPQPQLPGLGDPATGRSGAATTGGAGDEEEELMALEGTLSDFVLIQGKVLDPTPLWIMKQGKEVSAPLHPGKQCVQCGDTEAPQWRIQPVGLGVLCNACRIRLRPAEALREPVQVHRHLPPAEPATAVFSRREKSPSPEPVMAPVEKKQERKRKLWHPRQEQEFRPAASPTFKPSAEHACKHRDSEVVQLRQKKQYRGKEHHHQPPHPAAMQPRTGGELPTATGEPISLDQVLPDAVDGSSETHIVHGGELQMADPSSLELDDEFLFNGPSAPMLIDDDEEDLAD